MSEDHKAAILQTMVEEDDYEVLSVYLELAKHKILNRMYQFRDGVDYDNSDVPNKYVGVQLNIAAYLINKRGAEGEIQHIENGIHRNYGSSDVPDALLKDVIPYAQAIR